MRLAAIPVFAAFEVVSGVALAQSASDPLARLRACSLMERAERLECLDALSHSISPPARPTPAVSNWTISETTSPVDYTPIVVAVAPSRDGAESSAMQISLYCRGGRTELVVTGPTLSGRGEDYAISYRVNGGEPLQVAGGVPSFGTGIAFKGDVVRLLQSLPEEGDIAVRFASRTGKALEGKFSLGGLNMVRDKLAAACRWPQAPASSRN